MAKAVFYCAYKLKKDANEADFLAAAEKLNNEYVSKQPGYVSWQQLKGDDTWLDLCTFETMADVKNFEENSPNSGELSAKFYSYINLPSCVVRYYTVERNY